MVTQQATAASSKAKKQAPKAAVKPKKQATKPRIDEQGAMSADEKFADVLDSDPIDAIVRSEHFRNPAATDAAKPEAKEVKKSNALVVQPLKHAAEVIVEKLVTAQASKDKDENRHVLAMHEQIAMGNANVPSFLAYYEQVCKDKQMTAETRMVRKSELKRVLTALVENKAITFNEEQVPLLEVMRKTGRGIQGMIRLMSASNKPAITDQSQDKPKQLKKAPTVSVDSDDTETEIDATTRLRAAINDAMDACVSLGRHDIHDLMLQAQELLHETVEA